MFKKIISLLVAYSLLGGITPCIAANLDNYIIKKADKQQQPDTIYHVPEEDVMFIVEVEGSTLLDSPQTFSLGGNGPIVYTKEQREDEIVANQMNVVDKIQDEIPYIDEPDYVYTALFNGFAIKGKRSDMEKISDILGVKNVYISSQLQATPKLTSSVELAHALPEEILGVSGKGQAIAIIDNEFSTSHKMFQQSPANPKYTPDMISSIISNSSMNGRIPATQVYLSEKIPFAYDYVNKTSNTYSSTLSHGTHIAGIAAGDNAEGIKGIAPDAQLILMKVSNASGGMPEYAILQALNDAILLGVCAINCSFGVDYISADTAPLWRAGFDRAYDAGIYISAAADNLSKGFYNNPVLTENIDYSASSLPATISSVTSVASANNSSITYAFSDAVISGDEGIKLMQYYINQSFSDLVDSDGVDCVDCGYGLTSDFNGDISGKIALIRRGQTNFTTMATRAKNAGAIGIIIINSSNEYIAFPNLELPCALVTSIDGEKLLKSEKILSASPFKRNIEISDFSSYGTEETLELKPDITAPGGGIYSSVPTDTYKTIGGTSMAASHITGIIALMNEYLGEYSGSKNKIDYINNMLMSTATVLKYTDTDIPYSPRVQGAGLVDVSAALSTPVILYGDTGKTKLSLMDNLTNEIELSFSAENISDFDTVYDSISVDVLTDSYTQTDGENIVDKTRRLTAEIDKPESLTVTSKTTQTVNIDITLDETELSQNLEIFENGFFIEGFVHLESSQENVPSIGIPFMGFYGDWTKAPVFDKTIYDDGGSLLVNSDENIPGTFLATEHTEGILSALGYGLSDNGEFAYIKDYIAISPNSDGVCDNLQLIITPMRTIKDLTITFSDENMTPLAIYDVNGYLNKFYTTAFDDLSWIEEQPDGDYHITVDAQYNYNSDNPTQHSFTLPFYVDTVAPKILNASLNGNTLSVTASDNKNINQIAVKLPDGNEDVWFVSPSANGGTITIPPQSLENDCKASDILVTVTDCAGNSYSNTVSCLDGIIQPKISAFTFDTTGYSMDIDFLSSEQIAGCTLILSFYDKSGHLICTDIYENKTVNIGNSNLTFAKDADISSASTCKLFVWDNTKNLSYLDTAKEINISSYITH